MEARIYYIKKTSAIEAEDVAAHQNDIVGASYDRRQIIKIAEDNEDIVIYLAVASSHGIMREIAEEFETEINQEDVLLKQEVKAYSAEHLKIAMLNIACPLMKAYFGDLSYDLRDAGDMPTGSIAYWYIRETGTGIRVNEFDRFRQDMEDWGGKVRRSYRIYKNGYDEFFILPYNKK